MNLVVPAIRSAYVSMCAVISWHSGFFAEATDGSFNALHFGEFRQQMCISNAVVVMDSAAFHRSPGVSAVLNANGHTTMYLPLYSPLLSPIENVFSLWKEKSANARQRMKKD